MSFFQKVVTVGPHFFSISKKARKMLNTFFAERRVRETGAYNPTFLISWFWWKNFGLLPSTTLEFLLRKPAQPGMQFFCSCEEGFWYIRALWYLPFRALAFWYACTLFAIRWRFAFLWLNSNYFWGTRLDSYACEALYLYHYIHIV